VAAALDRVGLRDHLTHFLTSAELGVRKPDPSFFRAVSRALGIPGAALLAVGNDYAKDIVPAKAAGMPTALVSSTGETTGTDYADLVVTTLWDLPARVLTLFGRA
jgi:putative hydrolase of the HAD superfamily